MIRKRESMKLSNSIFLNCITGDLKILLSFSWETRDNISSNRNLILIWTIQSSNLCQHFIKLITQISSIHCLENWIRKALNRKMEMRDKPWITHHLKKMICKILRIDTRDSDSWDSRLPKDFL